MDYAETLRYLYSQLPMYQRIGAAAYKSDLGNTIAILRELKNPEKNFRSIHIAGTNGKGSVAHILAAILQSEGLKTGLYTSPHLKDFRERIRINGEMIPEWAVASFVEKHRLSFERIHPSFFEMTVALAFQYFSDQKVDIAVIETGLGGRLDSTNVIHPELSIITNIGHDHMQFLGSDITSIAREKAGIIKKGVPAVCGKMLPEALEVIREKAEMEGADLHYAPDEVEVDFAESTVKEANHLHFDASLPRYGTLNDLECLLTGNYQRENIMTALCACMNLSPQFRPSADGIMAGLRDVITLTGIRGRWETLNKTPLVIADTAHNEEGLMAVLAQWMSMTFRKRHIVLGLVDDKDPNRILRLFPSDADYYFCRPAVSRGMPTDKLMNAAKEAGLKGKAYESVREAYDAALSHAGNGDGIYIGGSTFVVAEVI